VCLCGIKRGGVLGRFFCRKLFPSFLWWRAGESNWRWTRRVSPKGGITISGPSPYPPTGRSLNRLKVDSGCVVDMYIYICMYLYVRTYCIDSGLQAGLRCLYGSESDWERGRAHHQQARFPLGQFNIGPLQLQQALSRRGGGGYTANQHCNTMASRMDRQSALPPLRPFPTRSILLLNECPVNLSLENQLKLGTKIPLGCHDAVFEFSIKSGSQTASASLAAMSRTKPGIG
jgi:hypothetical protein